MGNKKEKAFTLLEVLIALLVLAITLTAALLTLQNSVRHTEHIKKKLAAHWVAMNIISSLQVGLLKKPGSKPVKGKANMLGGQYTWVVGIDHKGNGYFGRIYIDVYESKTYNRLEHLVGFLE